MQFTFDGSWSYWGPAALVVVSVLGVCAVGADWRGLMARNERFHLFWAAGIGLSVFWLLGVNVHGMMTLHPLLMMSLCVIFGARLGVLCGALAVALNLLWQSGAPEQWPLRVLINVLAPALVAQVILWGVGRLPMKNLFVFMLGGGFLGGMLTVQGMALSGLLYVGLFGPDPLWVIAWDNYYLSWLLMFPEGFMNGAFITVLAVMRPDLVKTYDDKAYLGDR